MKLVRFFSIFRIYKSLFLTWAAYIFPAVFLGKKVVILDFGANIGGGFKLLSRFFNPSIFAYRLYEPNLDCIAHLKSLRRKHFLDFEVFNCAVFNSNSEIKLFGLDGSASGQFPQGASLLENHNSASYDGSRTVSRMVKCVDVCDVIDAAINDFDAVIIKMDIEGAELEVLEWIFARGRVKCINIIFCEFHSRYLEPRQRVIAASRENALREKFKSSGVWFFDWN